MPIVPTGRRGRTLFSLQAEADEVATLFARMVDSVDRLRGLEAPVDWLVLCLRDAADDTRGFLDERADSERLNWQALDAVLERLEDRSAGNAMQLRLL